jgi:uncharacterized protein YidB (DUF937 family)
VGALSGLLEQNGGLSGLMNKFAQGGHGEAFSSWVGTGNNQPIAAAQIQNVLGSGQIQALATKLGIDPAMIATLLAQYLPMIIDKLTPTGQVDPAANQPQSLAAMLPSLLESLGGGGRQV